jgi:hypothetical protein
MANFDLESFRTNFQTGAKAYLFYIKLDFPSRVPRWVSTDKAVYLVRSSTTPDFNIEEIPVNWQGYDYKIGGKLTFSEWVVTFNVDIDAALHKQFFEWMKLIHDPQTNVHTNPDQYFQTQRVQLLGPTGLPVLTYKLVGAWPRTVGQITLDYAQNEIATFDITFVYQYHVIEETQTGTFLGGAGGA